MFITLTFVSLANSDGPTFLDRTINAVTIESFAEASYHDGERNQVGTKITWSGRGGSHVAIVTARPEQIAKALGAQDLTS